MKTIILLLSLCASSVFASDLLDDYIKETKKIEQSRNNNTKKQLSDLKKDLNKLKSQYYLLEKKEKELSASIDNMNTKIKEYRKTNSF